MDIYQKIADRVDKLAVVGLGYVGLPLAVAFANKVNVIGFDLNSEKVMQYRNGIDATGELELALAGCTAEFTSDPDKLKEARCFIVAVPTPVKSGNVPDLKFVRDASRMIGRVLSPGSIIVYESTVYPGSPRMCAYRSWKRSRGLLSERISRSGTLRSESIRGIGCIGWRIS